MERYQQRLIEFLQRHSFSEARISALSTLRTDIAARACHIQLAHTFDITPGQEHKIFLNENFQTTTELAERAVLSLSHN